MNVTSYEDKEQAAELASRAQIDAEDKRMSIKKALKELGHPTLVDYMLYVLNERADDEVDRLVSNDD